MNNYCSLLFFVLCMLSIQLTAQEVSYPIDGSHSVVSFSVGFAGGISSIDGRFDNFEGVIGYKDKSDRSSLFCTVTIEVSSLNTGNEMRDGDLQGGGWFDAAQFPQITFESTGTMKSDDGYAIQGIFSMMGIEEQIEIPFEYKHDQHVVFVFGEPRIATLGSYTIDRTKYGIPKRGFGNIVPALGTMALLKDVEIKLMIMGRGKSMGGLLGEMINEEGVGAAIAMYEKMEKTNDPNNGYEFGPRVFARIMSGMVKDGDIENVTSLGNFVVSKYPEDANAHYLAAMAHEASGDIESAKSSYQQALDIAPEFGRAQQALDKLSNK